MRYTGFVVTNKNGEPDVVPRPIWLENNEGYIKLCTKDDNGNRVALLYINENRDRLSDEEANRLFSIHVDLIKIGREINNKEASDISKDINISPTDIIENGGTPVGQISCLVSTNNSNKDNEDGQLIELARELTKLVDSLYIQNTLALNTIIIPTDIYKKIRNKSRELSSYLKGK